MSLSVSRLLTREEYQRLQAQASGAPDFAYIGSTGEGNARGLLCGFSALACESITVNSKSSDRARLSGLADEMEQVVEKYALDSSIAADFLSGGWIGFLSYELGYVREKRLAPLCPNVDTPLLHAGFYLWTASHNRTSGTYYLWIHPACEQRTLETLARWLQSDLAPGPADWTMIRPFAPRQSARDYRDSVSAIRDYISAGDCYQVNLSQEFSGEFRGNPWHAFQALAAENPTPYSAFIRAGGQSILSVSPERFLEIRGKTILTSPIKGTRPRGDTSAQDVAYSNELQASEKDRAENLMIVDLLRNDLGVSAEAGSVSVDALFSLESYRNVHHLVSHIRATLREDVSPMQALIDAFPGGSITGAPKIRAMEIIRELEPHWRGPYCGSVFYRGLNGILDSNIAIRTLLCDDAGTIRCWGGGGVVADSDPQAEYEETLTKVRPLMAFLEHFNT
ncbi:aminodeoxychorismate synthase component I [Marinobacter goseongensis]|uniref:aminodeoxychorismate synthase component I n=1 Tax=Marinobacter goseongensis TaxID=453838 RepID=UPI0020034160|nr:aminodeoxychorismate synthase component I [Marinobacter goseongensis]MCK7550049.1 aminodeoxychorismate synthase component I [Marinobacter goseongensis]